MRELSEFHWDGCGSPCLKAAGEGVVPSADPAPACPDMCCKECDRIKKGATLPEERFTETGTFTVTPRRCMAVSQTGGRTEGCITIIHSLAMWGKRRQPMALHTETKPPHRAVISL